MYGPDYGIGEARLGEARLGKARRGEVRSGVPLARSGRVSSASVMLWPGRPWFVSGGPRQGKVRRGEVRSGLASHAQIRRG